LPIVFRVSSQTTENVRTSEFDHLTPVSRQDMEELKRKIDELTAQIEKLAAEKPKK